MGGHSRFWWHAGRLWRGAFGLLWLFIAGLTASAVWNSGLTERTTTTSLRLRADRLAYTYRVGEQTFAKTESPGNLHKSVWQEPGAVETVRYLRVAPSRAHLDFKIERFSVLTALAINGFVLCLAYAGHLMMRTQARLERLVAGCTHVLPGRVTRVIPGQGFRDVRYEAFSPEGKSLSGRVQIGEAEPIKNDLVVGCGVAVLYRDVRSHTLL